GKKYVTVVDNAGSNVSSFDPSGIQVDTDTTSNKVTTVTTSQIKSGGYVDNDSGTAGLQEKLAAQAQAGIGEIAYDSNGKQSIFHN
ncbi:MAG: hypothetical protein EBT20_01505, partial [Alphaproteobacteria bacterium]|nr:hypothetical protein [Alphaproteobacteria bacterium]